MSVTTARTGCDRSTSVTRSLLGYGVLAGPFYLLVSLTEMLVRPGFDPARHQWSLLSNGHLGWIHVTNFVLTGLMLVAFGTGLRRALGTGPAATWAPRLIGAYGLGLVGAGFFRADPALGFPPGTPDGPGAVSWHGMLHLVCGAVGFSCLVVACFLLARRYARENRPGWALFSRLTGTLFLAGFIAVATGAGAVWANLAFTAGMILSWAWLCAVAVQRYRTAGSGN
jgi:hypothetical membrane protein